MCGGVVERVGGEGVSVWGGEGGRGECVGWGGREG